MHGSIAQKLYEKPKERHKTTQPILGTANCGFMAVLHYDPDSNAFWHELINFRIRGFS